MPGRDRLLSGMATRTLMSLEALAALPDGAFLAAELLEQEPAEAFFRGAPTIAIEVVSPSEAAADLDLKLRQYPAAGPKAVATVYPRTRTV